MASSQTIPSHFYPDSKTVGLVTSPSPQHIQSLLVGPPQQRLVVDAEELVILAQAPILDEGGREGGGGREREEGKKTRREGGRKRKGGKGAIHKLTAKLFSLNFPAYVTSTHQSSSSSRHDVLDVDANVSMLAARHIQTRPSIHSHTQTRGATAVHRDHKGHHRLANRAGICGATVQARLLAGERGGQGLRRERQGGWWVVGGRHIRGE